MTYFPGYSDDLSVVVLHGSFGNGQGVPDSGFHFIPEPDYHIHSLTAGDDLNVKWEIVTKVKIGYNSCLKYKTNMHI